MVYASGYSQLVKFQPHQQALLVMLLIKVGRVQTASLEPKALKSSLARTFQQAIDQAYPQLPRQCASISITGNAGTSDYQCNNALVIASQLRGKGSRLQQQTKVCVSHKRFLRCVITKSSSKALMLPHFESFDSRDTIV